MADGGKASSPYDEILKKGIILLKQLNPSAKFDTGNCPAVAAKVHDYLNGKGIHPLRVMIVEGDYVLASSDTAVNRGCQQIINDLNKQGHGHNVVVDATAGVRRHFVVLANIHSKIYYIDAYTQPPIITKQVAAYLHWARSLKVYKKFGVKYVPR
jgi:hypothetical protein